MKTEKVKYMLMAADMSRALKFYREVFGFNEGFTSDHWSELSFGNSIIAFHEGADGSPNPTGLSIQVSDVKAVCEAIKSRDGSILSEPYQREGEPLMLGFFRDPEGNEVMITQWLG